MPESFHNKLEVLKTAAPLIGVTGLLIAGIGYEADNLQIGGAEAHAAADRNQDLYRRSRMTLQPILNRIHRIVIPLDQEKTIKPTSAFMLPSSGGFRTDCSYGDASYKYYTVTPNGTAYEPCGRGFTYQQKNRINQYVEPLNKIGKDIRRSVGFTAMQTTTSIRGSRRSVTARFECAPDSTSTIGQVRARKIVLSKVAHHRYTRAAIQEC